MFNIVRKQQNPPTTTQPTYNEWDPFRVMESLLRSEPFTDLWGRRSEASYAYMPHFDVKENKESFLFKADLPGLKEEDIEISVTGNRLTICGKRDVDEQKEGENYFVWERNYGTFTRSFTLPDSADLDKIKANMKDGVLTLILPKRVESQPRKISIGKPS